MKYVWLLVISCMGSSVWATETVTLQLKWTHAFQFAGYYAAQALGYYRDAGLDVRIQPATPELNPVEEVTSGRAQFGVGSSSLLLARAAGKPVVALAAIFQHSPQMWIARQTKPLQSIHDLAGKRVMLEQQSDELIAYLQQEKVPLESLQILPHTYSIDDLINGNVDAMSSYATYEPFFLQQRGVAYQIYTPRSVGLDFYGDVLFTSEQELKTHPKQVDAFVAASLRGWNYAMAHPDEIIDLILQRYPSALLSREMLRFEARHMADLLRTDLVDIGYMTTGRWQHIAATYARLGIVPENLSLDGFLYQPDPKTDLTWLYWALRAILAALLIALTIAFYIHRINRRLAAAVAELSSSEERHRVIFQTTPSAGFVWRDPFIVTDWNREAESLFGWKREEVIGRAFTEFLLPAAEREQLVALLLHVLKENALPHNINNVQTRDGRIITCEWFNAWLPDRPDQPREVVSLARDITQQQRLEDEVRQLAFYDPLTKLPNRRLLHDRLGRVLATLRRDSGCGALIFLDLDNFKPLNDRHGHEVGDRLLVEVARRLTACVRETDTVARFGGDEFVILLGELDEVASQASTQAARVAYKILEQLRIPYHLRGEDETSTVEHHCSASIGVSIFNRDANADNVLRRADIAMYRAKEAGSNCVIFDNTDNSLPENSH